MSCDVYQVGMRIKAVADFRISENLAAPVLSVFKKGDQCHDNPTVPS